MSGFWSSARRRSAVPARLAGGLVALLAALFVIAYQLHDQRGPIREQAIAAAKLERTPEELASGMSHGDYINP